MTGHPLESLSALLDGELADAERRDVEAHLAGCPSCARHLRDLTAVDAMARGLPPVAVPDGYLEALPARVRARIRAERSPGRRVPWIWPLAAGLAIAVLAPLVLREGRSKESGPAESDRVATAPMVERSPVIEAKEPAAPPFSERAGTPQTQTQTQGYAATQSNKPVGAARERKQEAEQAKGAGAAEATEGRIGQERDSRSAAVAASSTAPAAAAPATAPAAASPARPGAIPGAANQPADASMRDEAVAETSAFAPEPDAAAPPSLMRKSNRAEVSPSGDEETAFRTVAAIPLSSAESARRARRGWARFLADHSGGARADEARVRQVEAAVAAFQASADPSDRAMAERDATAYLSDGDRPQAARVKAAIGRLDQSR